MLFPLMLTGCSAESNAKGTTATDLKQNEKLNQGQNNQSKNPLTTEDMSHWIYKSGDNPVKILNNDTPTTLAIKNFEKPHIDYSGLDDLNRTKSVTAYLTKNNLGRSKTRTEQIFKPTGWHNQPKIIDGSRVIPQNRGHLIAYTVTFNLNDDGQEEEGHLGSLNNPKNLFTQTAFSNQKTMTEVEQKVRTALTRNKKVIYQVTPIFRDNELMARGVWVQAISTDKTLKFNRYIWNVQGKIQFDYATGRSKIDKDFQVPGDDGKTQELKANYKNYRNHHKFHRQYHHKYH